MAAMDVGKRMMEKMGWSKGQGLGKDKQGMTSCIIMTKSKGSNTQGRIETAAPIFKNKKEKAEVKKEAPEVKEEPKDEPAPEPKRRRKEGGWEAEALAVPAVPAVALPPVGAPVPVFDIDPRDLASAAPGMAEAAAVAAQQMAQLLVASTSGVDMKAESTAAKSEFGDDVKIGLNGLPLPARRVRVRQYVIDDWRWSKGTEALRYFEEVQLVPEILEVATTVLGPNSRYPARITDETDCVTEVTAWGSLIVRPRGTGANVALAKKMLFEILHPGSEEMREDALFKEDNDAEAALNDKTTISRGMDEMRGLDEGVERTTKGKLKNVGIGAEGEALAELEVELPKAETHEIPLVTQDDRVLLKRHMEDLRIASGATPILNGGTLKLMGKDKQIRKATQLVKTLIETGEWVALTEGFILSEETKEKRRVNEGPSEQILIKFAEGPATKKIESHLKAMERASTADQLKLTSKAVSGKRTLMVQGTRAAHERVKLMVKELIEKGESPMLTKALGVARAAERAAAELAAARAVQAPKKSGPVISAPAQLNVKDEVKQEVKVETKQEVKEAKQEISEIKQEPGPVRITDDVPGVVDVDLFAGLPPPMDALPAPTPAAPAAAAAPAFPPEPPVAAAAAAAAAAAGAAPALPPQPAAGGAAPQPVAPQAPAADGAPAPVLPAFPPLPPLDVAGLAAPAAEPGAGTDGITE